MKENHDKLWKLIDKKQTINIESIKDSLARHLEYTVGKNQYTTKHADVFRAISYTVKDYLIDGWNTTEKKIIEDKPKRVYYLSMEFLMGRALYNVLVNLGLADLFRTVLKDFGYDLENIREYEPDAGLGNGGLGRLAACFLDSMATLDLPGWGYGIRYEFGIFRQYIQNFSQMEAPDNWLAKGYPFEIAREDLSFSVGFYGDVKTKKISDDKYEYKWTPSEVVLARPYDMPIPGFNTKTVNNLRLWGAHPAYEFNLQKFNVGDHMSAVEEKQKSENISKVLYPDDSTYQGRELRLKQQYFMVSATLQDILKDFKNQYDDIKLLPEKVAIQLNDTHPSIGIPELMRILLDKEKLEWEEAWAITGKVFSYTNHTVLPEALEKWPTSMIENLLPRHLMIVREINRRFLQEAEKAGLDKAALERVSIFSHMGDEIMRMANLSIVGSHTVNGVSALHTDIIKDKIFNDFHILSPKKIQNKTNGITQRRWLLDCNPGLSNLISKHIGNSWTVNLDDIKNILPMTEDAQFRFEWREVKRNNKIKLANLIHQETGIRISDQSLFDIQVKRIHEYKRQLLNLLSVIDFYNRIKDNPGKFFLPRTIIFGGKAAPAYYIAKLIIKLINKVAHVINHDKAISDIIKIVFIPNYNVSIGEVIFPATDLSQQISTAGMEASGTGNMKFALNGALTIGTLDGANVEIDECVGRDNIFIFGLTTPEVENLKVHGYNPWDYYHNNLRLKRVMDMISGDYFNKSEPGIFQPIFDSLLHGGDRYMLMADFASYIETQEKVEQAYTHQEEWTRKSIINVANMGMFSSDRTIDQYAKEIWDIKPLKRGESQNHYKIEKKIAKPKKIARSK